jgi:hypothetical protein
MKASPFAFTLALCLSTPLWAVRMIDYTPGSVAAGHWDVWVHEYTPGSGWSNSAIPHAGDSSGGFSSLFIPGGSLPAGTLVDLFFDFRVTLNVAPFGDHERQSGWLSEDRVNNFAGMQSSTLSARVGFGPIDNFDIEATFSQSGFGSSVFDVRLPGQGFVGNNELQLNVGDHTPLGHPLFTPHGLAVFDESAPAAYMFFTHSIVHLIQIESASVPEHGSTAGMLTFPLLVFVGMSALRCRTHQRTLP